MAHQLAKQGIVYAMSAANSPVLRAHSGDQVVIQTYDCFEDQIQDAGQDFGQLDWERINPATGPIYVEEAQPGDLLVVQIQKIVLADHGVMTTGPDLGVFGDELQQNAIRMIPVQDGVAHFSERLRLPINKMIGVIGTAPVAGGVACGTPGDHGGNMDCKEIAEGAYLILPVNVPGALFALGDLHAAMGDGEVAVCGIEIAGEVTVKLHVLKGKEWPVPMVFNDSAVITIASATTLDDAARLAAKNMARFLQSECGMELAEATLLLSVAGDLRICQIVDPLKTARYELPRWIAERHGFSLPLTN